MRPIAAQDSDARIAHLRLDRWIDYPRAAHVLKILSEMFDTPQRKRMPCLFVDRSKCVYKVRANLPTQHFD